MRFLEMMKNAMRSLGSGGFPGVALDAGLVFASKLAAAVLALLFNAWIARRLSPDAVGTFYLFQSIVLIWAVLLRGGLDNILLRESAVDPFGDRVGSLLNGSLLMVVVLAVLSLVAGWQLLPVWQQWTGRPLSVALLAGMALAAALLAGCVLYSESYRGARKMWLSQWLGANGLGLYAGLMLGVLVLPRLVILYVLALAVLFLTAVVCWPGRRAGICWPTGHFPQARWLFLAQLAEMSGVWSPVIALGLVHGVSDAGVFGPIYRMVLMASGMMVAFNMAGAPRFASLYQSGNINGLASLAKKKTAITACLSLPVFLLFLVFPEWCLGLYGQRYAGFGLVLAILAVSQLVNVLSGPVGYLLIMSRHEKAFAGSQCAGLLANVAGLVMAVPVWGIYGAALGLALGITVQNLLAWFFVKRLLGFYTLGNWRMDAG